MSEAKSPVRVTMVKKRLASGEPCKKCAQAEEMLRRRELWDEVDEVVWADENDKTSAGMVLAQKYGVETAPFFLVARGDDIVVEPSAVKVAKQVLGEKKAARGGSAEPVSAGALDQTATGRLENELEGATPQTIVQRVLGSLGDDCAIAFSGAEDVALIDIAAKSGKKFSVFCLDTGRLHAETYRFIDTVRQYYGIEVHVVSPNFVSVEALVRKKGLFSFYEDGHGECCGVRKVEPLRRVLQGFRGWMTGQRRDQSPTRTDVPVVAWDTTHKSDGMVKANPLASWTQEQVWAYIRDNDVPYNPLHDEGFISIGCEPCTRQARPGEHERAARWWWEDSTKRECGLHVK